jgi:DNA-binding GntR family transcriptional regulator
VWPCASLEQEGLATVAAGNGRRQVAAFRIEDVSDLYDVRIALERYTARAAAERITAELLEALSALQDEMETLSHSQSRPSRRDFGVDFDFHRVVAQASGSKRALASLQPIWNQTHALLRHLYSIGVYADRKEDAASYRDHRAIIAALAARDAGGRPKRDGNSPRRPKGSARREHQGAWGSCLIVAEENTLGG